MSGQGRTFLLFLVLLLGCNTATPPYQQNNRQFFTDSFRLSFFSASTSPRTYTSLFYDVIGTIERVHYMTQTIFGETWNCFSPNNASNKIINYRIEAAGWGDSHLVTEVSGLLETPHLYRLGVRFMAIIAGNGVFGPYLIAEDLEFVWDGGTSVTSINSNYPTHYTLNINVRPRLFLRDIRTEYPAALQVANNNYFSVGVSTSWSGTYTTTSISLQSYMYNSDSWFRIRYFLVMYDPSTVSSGLPRYSFSSDTSSSTSVVFSLSADLSSPYTTLVNGIQYLYNTNSNWLSLYVWRSATSSSITYTFSGTGINSTFGYWATVYTNCDRPHFYLETDTLCYPVSSTCLSSEFYDYSSAQCLNCSAPCLTCYSLTECLTCDPASNRHLFNLQCIPLDGFYQGNNSVADPCTAPCLTCSLSGTNCTSCQSSTPPLYLLNNSCLTCSQLFQGCQLCNLTTCFSCNSSYHKINDTFCNVNCDNSRCWECLNTNASYCLKCWKQQFTLNDGYCQGECGDGVMEGSDECDDGNLNDYDGCSPQCLVQNGYNCTTKSSFLGHNYTAYCSYLQQVNLTALTVEKLADSNSLRIIVKIGKYSENFWKDYGSFGQYVFVDVGYHSMQAELVEGWTFTGNTQSRLLASPRAGTYSDRQTAAIQFQYTSSLEGHNIALTLSFAKSNDPRVSTIPPQTITVSSKADNNHRVYNYTEQTYSLREVVFVGLSFIGLAYYGLYLVSLIAGHKRVAAEGLMVAQVVYVGMAGISLLSPLHSATSALTSTNNPLNIFYSESFRPFDDPLMPNRLRGTQFYAHFLYNLNTSLAFVVLPLVLGFVLFLIRFCKCFSASRQEKIKSVCRMLLGEYVFAGLTLVGCVFGASTVLEIKFGLQDISEGMMGLVACAVVGFLLLLYAVFWLKLRQLFGQYKDTLKDGNFRTAFVLFYFFLGPAAGAVTFLLYDTLYGTIAVLCIAFTLYVLLFAFSVYRKSRDRLRVMANLLTITGIYSCYLFFQINPNYNYTDSYNVELMLPLTTLILLALNLCVNLAIFIYLLVKRISDCCHSKEQIKDSKEILQAEEQSYCSQRHEEIKNMCGGSFNTPLQAMASPNYRTRFIYQSQKQKNPISKEEQKFKADVYGYLEVQQEDAEKTLNKRAELESKPRLQGNRILFSKFKYTAQNHLLERQYDDIDRL